MKVSNTMLIGVVAVATLAGATGNRKVTQNKLSPSAETSITLNGKAVTIEYNAPSARGRKVSGELVPFNQVWRLGADSATTLTTDANLKIGTLSVPKGVYTLYIFATEDGAQLIVNKQTGQWGTEYDKAQDLGRVAMETTHSDEPVETLNINLKKTGDAGATLRVAWGPGSASVPITAE